MSGTRLYSINEIKEMCSSKIISDELRMYLNNAPQSVRKTIIQWYGEDIDFLTVLGDEEGASEVELPELEVEAEDTFLETDETAEEVLVPEFENVVDNCEETNIDNPYETLDFSDRIEVDKLWLHIAEDNKCPIHDTPLERIQVVVKFDQRKRFGIITQCCKMCKRVYCSQAEIDEIKDAFSGKNVPCEVAEK